MYMNIYVSPYRYNFLNFTCNPLICRGYVCRGSVVQQLSGFTMKLFYSLQPFLWLFDCWSPVCAYALPYRLLEFL